MTFAAWRSYSIARGEEGCRTMQAIARECSPPTCKSENLIKITSSLLNSSFCRRTSSLHHIERLWSIACDRNKSCFNVKGRTAFSYVDLLRVRCLSFEAFRGQIPHCDNSPLRQNGTCSNSVADLSYDVYYVELGRLARSWQSTSFTVLVSSLQLPSPHGVASS